MLGSGAGGIGDLEGVAVEVPLGGAEVGTVQPDVALVGHPVQLQPEPLVGGRFHGREPGPVEQRALFPAEVGLVLPVPGDGDLRPVAIVQVVGGEGPAEGVVGHMGPPGPRELPGGAATGGASDSGVKHWQETLAKHGRETELGGDLIVGVSTFIDDTEEKAKKGVKRYFEENMKMFAPLGFVRGLSDDQITALGRGSAARSAGLPTIEDAIKTGAWLVGPPELGTERLMELQDRFPGLREGNVGASVMSTEQSIILEQLELFGKEVMPKFKSQSNYSPLLTSLMYPIYKPFS